jgi:hypothetical protein
MCVCVVGGGGGPGKATMVTAGDKGKVKGHDRLFILGGTWVTELVPQLVTA